MNDLGLQDIAFAGVGGQRALLASRSLSAVDLMSLCLDRIERINPTLNAFTLVRADEARREAAEAHAALIAGDQRPLLGIPFAVKDELDLAGCPTSFGTGVRRTPAERDAAPVRLLRRAGAIALGKTTLPELGTHGFTSSVAWGATRNPWDPSRTPGGSSGGSAAAVAAGLVPFATGGDGGGSLRIPASCCNLFALKTQRGRVPNDGAHDPDHDLTVNGVLTRSVEDAALVYDVLAHAPTEAWKEPLAEGARRDPGRLRIGVTSQLGLPTRVDSEVRRLVSHIAQTLSDLRHDVFPTKVHPGNWGVPFSVLGLRLLTEQAGPVSDRTALEPCTQAALRVADVVPDRLVRWAGREQDRITARMVELFDGLDAILTPTMALPPPAIEPWSGKGLLRDGFRMARHFPFTSLWNFVGLPAVNIPAGFLRSGLPAGAQLLGGPDSEPMLVAVSSQLERELRWTEQCPADLIGAG